MELFGKYLNRYGARVMIPANISSKSILISLESIDNYGIPKDRHSAKWSLKHEGKLYPPKYVISIANRLENGQEWPPEKFSGGRETNQFLENLGFQIIGTGSKATAYPLESHSWRAISDTVAIKMMDKSSFLHHGSGVPRDFKAFFEQDQLSPTESVDIKLIHKGVRYDAHFQMDKPLERMRLFWLSDFADLIKTSLPEWHQAFSMGKKLDFDRPEMRFEKIKDSEYQVDFIRPDEIELDIDSEAAEEVEARPEGATRHYYGKRHERDPVNRRRAIEIHGYKCAVCGFDFEAVYGERGKGFIEVHHTKPLSEVSEAIVIDPATDLVPVCSNCHRMIHRRKDDVLSIVGVKNLLK